MSCILGGKPLLLSLSLPQTNESAGTQEHRCEQKEDNISSGNTSYIKVTRTQKIYKSDNKLTTKPGSFLLSISIVTGTREALDRRSVAPSWQTCGSLMALIWWSARVGTRALFKHANELREDCTCAQSWCPLYRLSPFCRKETWGIFKWAHSNLFDVTSYPAFYYLNLQVVEFIGLCN